MKADRRLDVSLVIFHSDLEILRRTLESLRLALLRARDAGLLEQATVWLVDNGSDDPVAVDRLSSDALKTDDDWIRLTVRRGHGNVGYGAGHDLALTGPGGRWNLVLNPDVEMDEDALVEGLRFLEARPEVGLITPHAVDDAGRRLFLCKRYPGVLVLGLRGFAPEMLRRPFQSRLDRYEMRDLSEDEVASDIPIASGCFMLARAEVLRSLGGFSPRYFLYFEDFDLSLRLSRIAAIAYVPTVRIVHLGGEAARKGLLHQRLFVRSALTFFSTHGWKLW